MILINYGTFEKVAATRFFSVPWERDDATENFSVASYSVNAGYFAAAGFRLEAIQAEIEVPVTW